MQQPDSHPGGEARHREQRIERLGKTAMTQKAAQIIRFPAPRPVIQRRPCVLLREVISRSSQISLVETDQIIDTTVRRRPLVRATLLKGSNELLLSGSRRAQGSCGSPRPLDPCLFMASAGGMVLHVPGVLRR